MEILTTTTGIYPKVTSSKEVPSLRSNLHKFDREEITADELENVIQANIKRAVTEQSEAGIDLPTDGLIRWTDLFSPFVAAPSTGSGQGWDGLTRRGIHRFYNTNTLYGEPVLEGDELTHDLKYNPSKTLEDFKFALTLNENVKATLPGVFTFAQACLNRLKTPQKIIDEIKKNLLLEAKALVAAGAKMIEIHEPELGWGQLELPAKEIIRVYKEFGELPAKIIVTSYFRNFSQGVASALIDAGCGVGIDFSQPVAINSLPEGAILQAGVVDSRETKLESSEDLMAKKSEILEKFGNAAEIIFSTSSHVEYLPHGKALEKIALLKNLKS
ncbi:MAG: hypothetical protein ABIH35_03560 [Patescibacteria group bacterium]